jgi:hypothetical protein
MAYKALATHSPMFTVVLGDAALHWTPGLSGMGKFKQILKGKYTNYLLWPQWKKLRNQ